MVLFAWSFRLDCSLKIVAVEIKLPLAFFVLNPPQLAFIIVIPPITNPISSSSPAFLQWTNLFIPLGEALVEMQTIFLLTFLNKRHDSTPLMRFFTAANRWKFGHVRLFCCQRTRGEDFIQFPYFSELFETTTDGRMVHIEVFSKHSRSQAFVLFHYCQKCLVEI